MVDFINVFDIQPQPVWGYETSYRIKHYSNSDKECISIKWDVLVKIFCCLPLIGGLLGLFRLIGAISATRDCANKIKRQKSKGYTEDYAELHYRKGQFIRMAIRGSIEFITLGCIGPLMFVIDIIKTLFDQIIICTTSTYEHID